MLPLNNYYYPFLKINFQKLLKGLNIFYRNEQ